MEIASYVARRLQRPVTAAATATISAVVVVRRVNKVSLGEKMHSHRPIHNMTNDHRTTVAEAASSKTGSRACTNVNKQKTDQPSNSHHSPVKRGSQITTQ